MDQPYIIAKFKLPVALSVPGSEIDRIRCLLSKSITGSDDPVNILDELGNFVENPRLSAFREQLQKAHWSLNASHYREIDVAVFSDGSLEIN